jgi:hypothetical protein
MAQHQLPLPDYDQLPLGELRHRIRSLEEDQLRALFEHEQAHGDRIRVLELLNARLGELAEGVDPAPGDQASAPGVAGTSGGSRVQPVTAAEPTAPRRHGLSEQTPSRGRP